MSELDVQHACLQWLPYCGWHGFCKLRSKPMNALYKRLRAFRRARLTNDMFWLTFQAAITNVYELLPCGCSDVSPVVARYLCIALGVHLRSCLTAGGRNGSLFHMSFTWVFGNRVLVYHLLFTALGMGFTFAHGSCGCVWCCCLRCDLDSIQFYNGFDRLIDNTLQTPA